MRAYRVRCWLATAVLLGSLAGCDLFSTRAPDPPLQNSGTYLQPDTPDQVVENVQNAIAELNAQNYRRSFSADLRFEPTADAAAREASIWTGWSAQEEESYFRTLVEAARFTSGNELRLDDVEQTAGPNQHTFDASYVLTVNHSRPELRVVQGRLVWTIDQGEDGLWRITSWSDRSIGDAPSWSDLKAAFVK